MNDNCLEDRACPECGQSDRLCVSATTVFEITDEGTDEYSDVEYDDDSFASCPNCDWEGEWWQTEVGISHDRLLIKTLEEHPEEAMAIAARAVLGLLLVPGTEPARVLTSDEDYDSACDYLEYVEQAIMAQPNLHRMVMGMQRQSEERLREEEE